jgi:lipoyl synthase
MRAASGRQRDIAQAQQRHRPARRLPPWLKRPVPAGGALSQTARTVANCRVATVCEEARCPNRSECWSHHTVTFMILGRTCTRSCAFCAVSHGQPGPPDADEPQRLAESVATLGARHVVITSVTRDDLPDEGAGQFAASVHEVHRRLPCAAVEVLTPDMHARSECIERICAAGPSVYNHNIETVRRLTPSIRPQADYDRSLDVLRTVRQGHAEILTKSGLLLGIGEQRSEINEALSDLRGAGCAIVTIGQYLQPTPAHRPVARYWRPEEFDAIGRHARSLGFASVAAGPFVRSSYNAAEAMAAARTTRDCEEPIG